MEELIFKILRYFLLKKVYLLFVVFCVVGPFHNVGTVRYPISRHPTAIGNLALCSYT